MARVARPGPIRATLDTDARTSDIYAPDGHAFTAAVRGTFVANLRLQVSLGNASNDWIDVFVFEQTDVVTIAPTGPTAVYRLTMAADGDFTSGSAAIFIGE